MSAPDTTLSSRSNYAKEIWEKDKNHFVHPWANWSHYREEGAAMTMAGSEGPYVIDIEGNKYLDGIGGLWCVNIGYGREEMVQAIADQVRKLPYFSPFTDTTNTPGAELAAKIAELAPGDLNHVFFTTGGSTAIDSSYRLVQAYFRAQGKNEKRHVIGRHEAYHGSTYIAQSIGCKEMDRNELFEFKEDTIHHISAPDMYRKPEKMSESQYCDHLVNEFANKLVDIGSDKVAAFFAEPIMGAGGVRVAPEGYHRRIWELCQDHDILFVADEVVTAFGRLGHWFVSKEMFDVQPDIITCAKGLTSGYIPLGAMIFSTKIYDVIAQDKDRYFTNGFTYSGHPVACAAGLKSIEIMEREDIPGHVRKVGAYFRDQLDSLSDLATVGDVRGSHFMCCIEFVGNKETKELFDGAVDIGSRVAREAEKHGLIVRPVAHLNVLSPCLTVTKDQCDFMVSTLRTSIEKVQDDLRAEGVL
jgi:putrescine aminotransferase